MEEDDISAVVIKIESKNSVQIIKPDDDFSFPEDDTPPFDPTPAPTNNNPINNIDMQGIRQNFNGVAKDFNEVKNTLSLQKMLLFAILGMLVLNIFFIYLSRPKKDDKIQQVLVEKSEKIKSLEKDLKTVEADFKNLEKENQKLKKDLAKIEEENNPETKQEKTK